MKHSLKPIKHIKISKEMKTSELVSRMKDAGFGARKLGISVDILEQAIQDKECKVFLGLAGAMVPGGMREIIMDMLKNGWIDVLVSTGANLTHDLIEALGFKHYIGSEKMNDAELHRKKLDRIYDVLMPNKVYVELEKFFVKNFDELAKAESVREFLWNIGKIAPRESILGICYEKKIPIFCPALTDSGIGLMVWSNIIRKKKIFLDEFKDLDEMIKLAWTKKKAVFYIGGGTPKNYIQQAMQFSQPASFGVQITTDRAEPGGSSGAPLCEGISWGKMNEKGKFIDVFCDATIALPLIYSALIDRIEKQ